MKRILTLILIMCCVLLTACNDSSIGVIGGADGPKTIIVEENKGKGSLASNTNGFYRLSKEIADFNQR